jgi:hypothetical protein
MDKKTRKLYHLFSEGVWGMKTMEFEISFFIEVINMGVNLNNKTYCA